MTSFITLKTFKTSKNTQPCGQNIQLCEQRIKPPINHCVNQSNSHRFPCRKIYPQNMLLPSRVTSSSIENSHFHLQSISPINTRPPENSQVCLQLLRYTFMTLMHNFPSSVQSPSNVSSSKKFYFPIGKNLYLSGSFAEIKLHLHQIYLVSIGFYQKLSEANIHCPYCVIVDRKKMKPTKRKNSHVAGDLSILQDKKNSKPNDSSSFATADDLSPVIDKLALGLEVTHVDKDSCESSVTSASIEDWNEDELLMSSSPTTTVKEPPSSSTPTKGSTQSLFTPIATHVSSSYARTAEWVNGSGSLPNLHKIPPQFSSVNDSSIKPANVPFSLLPSPGKTRSPIIKIHLKIKFSSVAFRKRHLKDSAMSLNTQLSSLIVSVIPTDYPAVLINMKEKIEITKVMNSNLIDFNKMAPTNDPDKKIHFTKCEIKHGHLQFSCANLRTWKWLKLTFEATAWSNELPIMECLDAVDADPLPTFSLLFPQRISYDDLKVVMQMNEISTEEWILLHFNFVKPDDPLSSTRFIFLGSRALRKAVMNSKNRVLSIFHLLLPRNITIRYIPSERENLGNRRYLDCLLYFYKPLHLFFDEEQDKPEDDEKSEDEMQTA